LDYLGGDCFSLVPPTGFLALILLYQCVFGFELCPVRFSMHGDVAVTTSGSAGPWKWVFLAGMSVFLSNGDGFICRGYLTHVHTR
jgi:hypothetical protein